MPGILESVLTARYGEPLLVVEPYFQKHVWNPDSRDWRCELLRPTAGQELHPQHPIVLLIYGEFAGGDLLDQSLSFSLLCGPPIYGIYQLEDLQARAEIRLAMSVDPAIFYFMTASNVQFYGIKNDQLFEFDSSDFDLSTTPPTMDEVVEQLQCLGTLESAIIDQIDKWEDAISS